MGPTGQDFAAAFELGTDDTSLLRRWTPTASRSRQSRDWTSSGRRENDRIDALEARLAKLESKDHHRPPAHKEVAMSFTRRSTLIVLAGLLSGSLSAQTDDPIANWPAAPFWVPPKVVLARAEAPDGSGRLSPEAVEGGPAGPLAFTAITPCRIVDTRGNGFTGA
jgi:hypothetical protein